MLSTADFEVPAAQISAALKGDRKRAAVAGADTEVVLQSARDAQEAGLIEPVLVGDAARMEAAAGNLGWDVSGFQIIDCADEKEASAVSVGLARTGEVEVLMKGSVHTDTLMRAVVDKETGLRTGQRMSHIFQMTFPGHRKALYITDASLNVAPDVTQRIHITRNAVAALNRIGVETPRVAVLSAVELPSPAVPSSMEARRVADLAADGEIEDAVVEGPLSMDLAISPAAASVKGLESEVAGRADLLVVPNIETGNALFKTLVYFRSATAAGLVLGARVPIVLTSRADPPEARLAAVALAMMV